MTGEALAAGLLAEHAATDEAEDAEFGDARRDEFPPRLRRRAERLARLRAAKQRLDEEDAARVASKERKKAEWQARKEAGTRRGAQPGEESPGRGRVSRRGPTPRIRTLGSCAAVGGLVQGYNVRAAVTADQIVVGAQVSQQPVDAGTLFPVVDEVAEQLAAAGIDQRPDTVLADAGYASEAAFAEAKERDLHLLSPLVSDERRADGADPAGSRTQIHRPATGRARAKLRIGQGKDDCAPRGRTVEPVFGQIKDRQGLRQFTRRGLDNVRTEWTLACTVRNIRKIRKIRKIRVHRLANASTITGNDT